MTYPQKYRGFLNEMQVLSGAAPESGCDSLAGAGLPSFGLSSGAGLSACGTAGALSSAASLCLLERLVSRGSLLLAGGRRYTAAAVLAACVGATAAPAVWAQDIKNVTNGESVSGFTLGLGQTYQGMTIYSGGTATSTTISSAGQQFVNKSGVAISTTISSAGVQHVESGGSANNTTIGSGGLQYMQYNAVTSDTIIDNGGTQIVYDGGSAYNVLQREGGAMQMQVGGGSMASTIVSGINAATNSSFRLSNGSASGFVLYSGAVQTVRGHGVTSATRIEQGGLLFVSRTGSAVGIDGPVSGSLGGFGTVFGQVNIASGGMLFPTGSKEQNGPYQFGSMTVSGDVTISSGGIYQVRVNASGSGADCVIATGSINVDGAVFQHVADAGASGDDFMNKNWLVMSGGGGVTGEFGAINTTLAFFKPVLDYQDSGKELWVSFERTLSFSDFASTFNQKGVASGLASLEQRNPDSPLILQILGSDKAAMTGLYDQLNGEIHGTLASGLAQFDRSFALQMLNLSSQKALAQAMLSSSVPAFDSAQALASLYPRARESRLANDIWADVGYGSRDVDGDGNARSYTLKGPDVSLGYNHIAPSGWLGGLAFRYGDSKMKVDSLLSESDIDSYAVGGHAGFQTAFGPGLAQLVLGGIYTRHEIDAKRHVNLGGGRQRLDSDYYANSYQLFMEGAYAQQLGLVWVQPFINLAWSSLRVSDFTEKGGTAALQASARSQNNATHLLGLRLAVPVLGRIHLQAQAGWLHTYGKLNPAYSLGFVEGGDRFAVKGSKINRNEAILDLRAEYALQDHVSLGLEGNAALGERGHSVRGGAFIALEW